MSLGHDIGLHFDAGLYNCDYNSLELACKKELEKLENIINRKIEIVSFHRPAAQLIGKKTKIANRFHTYMPELIRDIKYCSDSGGCWKYDDPEDLINNRSLKSIQLLTHPIWWTTPRNLTPGEKINHHFKFYSSEIKKEAAKNCIPYQEYLIAKKIRN